VIRGRRPMLASSAAHVPRGPDWLFEVKWDGYRALAYVEDGRCELESRSGHSLTDRFAAVAAGAAAAVRVRQAVIDGEICALNGLGRPSFSDLQQGSGRLVLFAFDVLEAEHEPLAGLPLVERRRRLAALLDPGSDIVRLSEAFDDGDVLLEAARAHRLEGVVAKRRGSRYAEGRRSRDWVKVKTHSSGDFVVVGYTRGSGRRTATFGSLLLAARASGRLRYVGSVGAGFREADLRDLRERLAPLVRPASPLSGGPKLRQARQGDVTWVEPELVVEVVYRELTRDGRLRQPTYKGLRDDLPLGGSEF
jgi:bifunctional non-homologous end joining protein LigD